MGSEGGRPDEWPIHDAQVRPVRMGREPVSNLQYAWFLAHDNYRRYEVPVPEECMERDGRLCLQLRVPEPENAPYIREIRLEVEE